MFADAMFAPSYWAKGYGKPFYELLVIPSDGEVCPVPGDGTIVVYPPTDLAVKPTSSLEVSRSDELSLSEGV